MPRFQAYTLIDLVPPKLREYAVISLDRAYEELEGYLRDNDIELREQDIQKLMLAFFMNFVDDIFVKSNQTYEQALTYLSNKDIIGIRFGRNSFTLNDPILRDWQRFVEQFTAVRRNLRQMGVPRGSSIPQLVEEVRHHEH